MSYFANSIFDILPGEEGGRGCSRARGGMEILVFLMLDIVVVVLVDIVVVIVNDGNYICTYQGGDGARGCSRAKEGDGEDFSLATAFFYCLSLATTVGQLFLSF